MRRQIGPAAMVACEEMAPTPILDRTEPLPVPKTPNRLAHLVAGALIGVAAVRIIPTLTARIAASPLILVASAFAAYYIAILVHELGHVVVALTQNFEFRELDVGAFVVSRKAA